MTDLIEYSVATGIALAGFLLALNGSAWYLLLTVIGVGYVLMKDYFDDQR